MNCHTTSDGPIFCLRNLPEDVIAMAFAGYSRSERSLRDVLSELLGDAWTCSGEDVQRLVDAQRKTRSFGDKWVRKFHHASIAEHAVVHMGIEDVSILAAKEIEDCRLASYTEKSTRYTTIDENAFIVPEDVIAHPTAYVLYDSCCRKLLHTYRAILNAVETAWSTDVADEVQARKVHRRALDVARYLLPCATKTSLGMTINARALGRLLQKLYASPICSIRNLARDMELQALQITGTFFKRPRDCDRDDPAVFDFGFANPCPQTNDVELLYRDGWYWPNHIQARGGQLRRDAELFTYVFAITVDQGAYRDIQRHRMATQFVQTLDTSLGYETPPAIETLGLGNAYDDAMETSERVNELVKSECGPEVAQYVLPLAWRRRVILQMNLRELAYFVKLRSAPNCHPSYRRIAQRMAELVCDDPFASAYITANQTPSEGWDSE